MNRASRSSVLALGLIGFSSAFYTQRSNAVWFQHPSHSMKSLLARFTAPEVPELGPGEVPIERSWQEPTSLPTLPGGGIGRHPMLYAGEGYNNLILVRDGKVIWNYFTGAKGELDDVWLLSNGNILFSRQWQVEEVNPQKEIVWHYDVPAGAEVHSCQPIGLDRVLMVQNGLPPKLLIINKKTSAIEVEHELPAVSLTDPKTVHPQFRRIRMTAAGTYLVPFLKLDKVVEYDKQFHELWSCPIPTRGRLHGCITATLLSQMNTISWSVKWTRPAALYGSLGKTTSRQVSCSTTPRALKG